MPAVPADTRAAVLPVATVHLTKLAPRLGSYDALAVFSVAAFAVYVGLALAGAGGRTMPYAYPAGCLFIALIAYVRSPATYVAFTWWTWLLTPLIRRVFDLRYGFHPTSAILLGPLLATSVAVVTIARRRGMLRSSAYIPFTIAVLALSYAFLIGIIRQSPAAAAYDLLTWLAPLLFGLHLALEWQNFPRLSRTLLSSILFGILVVAAYGILQFVNPPAWDRSWVINAEMQSVGAPVPFVIRVFSTLNAPGPFSIMLVFSLLIGMAARQRWKALPLAIGLVALVLTKGRSAWGAFVVGALVLQFRQPIRSLPRQWFALMVVILLAAPLITQPRIMAVLTGRAASLGNVSGDQSFLARVETTRQVLTAISENPIGMGLGKYGGASKLVTGNKIGTALDSGPLEIFDLMGWVGGTLYMMALVAIILPIARSGRRVYEPITAGALAAVIALLAASLFGNIFTSVSGFFFWTAIGLATAGRTYAGALELASRFVAPVAESRALLAQHTTAE